MSADLCYSLSARGQFAFAAVMHGRQRNLSQDLLRHTAALSPRHTASAYLELLLCSKHSAFIFGLKNRGTFLLHVAYSLMHRNMFFHSTPHARANKTLLISGLKSSIQSFTFQLLVQRVFSINGTSSLPQNLRSRPPCWRLHAWASAILSKTLQSCQQRPSCGIPNTQHRNKIEPTHGVLIGCCSCSVELQHKFALNVH